MEITFGTILTFAARIAFVALMWTLIHRLINYFSVPKVNPHSKEMNYWEDDEFQQYRGSHAKIESEMVNGDGDTYVTDTGVAKVTEFVNDSDDHENAEQDIFSNREN